MSDSESTHLIELDISEPIWESFFTVFPLVIVGSRGLTPLQEIVLGSVSERVARLASCPVTIVR